MEDVDTLAACGQDLGERQIGQRRNPTQQAGNGRPSHGLTVRRISLKKAGGNWTC